MADVGHGGLSAPRTPRGYLGKDESLPGREVCPC